MYRRRLLLSSLLLVSVGTLSSEQQRAITPEDADVLANVSDPQVSVNGQSVAYVLTTVDREKNKLTSSIWIVPVDGSAGPHQFIDKAPAHSPRWSPDGKWLAYLGAGAAKSGNAPPDGAKASSVASARPKPQVFLVSRDGTLPHQVTFLSNGVSMFDWSPDSTQLIAVSRTIGSDQTAPATDVRHYTSLVYKRDGYGWLDQSHGHLWLIQISSGETRQITSGDTVEDSDPHWSPDGKWIAYTHEEMGNKVRFALEGSELQIIPAAGGLPHGIASHQVQAAAPAWSPDSQTIAYIATNSFSEKPQLWIADAAGKHRSVRADDTDLFASEAHWTSDGALWFGAADHGTAHVFRIAPGSKHATRVIGGERAVDEASLSLTPSTIVFRENDSLHPPALFAADLRDGHEHQLTFHNRKLLSQLDLVKIERLNFAGADGRPIQGFFMKPLGWHPGQRYPMILSIHGGPSGMFGELWEMDLQLYAAQGWAVFICNPRGSSGYGMEFQRAVAEQWGGKPYQDLMKGVDAALAQNRWIDHNHLGVVGWSYGGFMTDWLITQTHRFKAAISIAGISDLVSVEGTRDYAYGHSRDFGGDIFTHPALYRKYSAVLHANQVITPTLFLQGEADERVPPSQSEEYFRALKYFGVPAELVLFPRENHMLPVAAEPQHLVESYQWRIDWFKRYLGSK